MISRVSGPSGGILTVRGARTSHAAVVARQMGKVCIVDCGELKIDPARRACIFPGRELFEGDYITLNGRSGKIYAGIVPVVVENPTELIEHLRQWSSDKLTFDQ